MKNLIILSILFVTSVCFGQINSSFSYQGLLLDENGEGISNSSAEFIINISGDDQGAVQFYEESQNVMTDDNGVFDFVIGNGNVLAGDMSDVEWLASVPYIRIQYNLGDGQGMRDLGFTKFQSVPFCMFSKYVVCQKGLDGLPGNKGPTGLTGQTGATGAQGAIGAVGATGPIGDSGEPITEMLAIAPSAPQEGTVYLDSGSNRVDGLPGFRYYDGSGWLDL